MRQEAERESLAGEETMGALMAMVASTSTAGGAAASACCYQRRQFCFSPLQRRLSFLSLRSPVPVLVLGRDHVRVLMVAASTCAASRSRGVGRGVKWKGGGAATAAATRMGRGKKEPQPVPPEAVTFSANISTDLPLHDSPEASFDEYLDDRPRIFSAMFPDRRRCRRLNDEEWRVQMLPIQFLFASVDPVVVMRLRCRSQGRGYPPEVPSHVTRVLELQATRWELQGLEGAFIPPHFALDVRGLLYSERGEHGGTAQESRLKGHLETSISLVLPPVLALVPEHVIRGVAESVLRTLVGRMKKEVDGSLLSDFQSFQRERLRKHLSKRMVARQPPVQDDPDPGVDSQPTP